MRNYTINQIKLKYNQRYTLICQVPIWYNKFDHKNKTKDKREKEKKKVWAVWRKECMKIYHHHHHHIYQKANYWWTSRLNNSERSRFFHISVTELSRFLVAKIAILEAKFNVKLKKLATKQDVVQTANSRKYRKKVVKCKKIRIFFVVFRCLYFFKQIYSITFHLGYEWYGWVLS